MMSSGETCLYCTQVISGKISKQIVLISCVCYVKYENKVHKHFLPSTADDFHYLHIKNYSNLNQIASFSKKYNTRNLRWKKMGYICIIFTLN